MRNQSWLPDGTLVRDEEIWQDDTGVWYTNHLTGEHRPATEEETALLPDPDIDIALEILSTHPGTIEPPQLTQLVRIFAKLLNITPIT